MNGDRDPAPLRDVIEHRYADLPEVRLHVVEARAQGGRAAAGAEQQDAPLVVLLHGFPEAWFAWQHQIPALARAGYRVLAPDMRGYNLSQKPKALKAYCIEHLVGDVADLIRWAGGRRTVVVGHDWGANVAWHFAMRRPDMLDRLIIMNVPHPSLMPKALAKPPQLLKSSYMFFFQFRGLAERLFLARDAAVLRKTLEADPVRPGAFTAEDIERYVTAVKRPGALAGGMNYYRAAFRQPKEQAQPRVITAPVLVVWGEQDRYIGKELADPPRELVPNVRVERLADASHWVQNDRPERVNELMLGFLRGQ
jgi:pimeloyl-ACP methyl ester carboxylesterase